MAASPLPPPVVPPRPPVANAPLGTDSARWPPAPPAPPRAAPVTAPPAGPPAGWYVDPWRTAPMRWWDGRVWTGYVSLPVAPPPVAAPPAPTLPLRAGLLVLGVLAAALLLSRFALQPLVNSSVPLLVVVVLSVLLAYGPALAMSLWVARKWGTGNLADTLGFKVQGRDIGFGLLTWLSILAGNIVLGLFIRATNLPLRSNVRSASGSGHGRTLLLALTLVAVVAAPLVEELLFRGVVLRAFRSVMPDRLAIVTQGVLFGLAHVQVAFGAGNLGLVLLLSWAGTAFGFVANRMRRLGPSIFGHATFNGVVFLVLWLAPHLLNRAR